MNKRRSNTKPAEKQSGVKWLIRLSITAAVIGSVYVVWLVGRPATPPTPPEVDIKSFEPLVAAAITNARSEVLKKPRSANAWGTLGCVFDAHSQSEAADTCYAQASMLSPNNFPWAYLRARLMAYQNRPEALPLLRKAALLQPDYLPLRIWMANALLRENKVKEAQREYFSALQLDTQSPALLLGLGRTLYLLGDLEEAHEYVRRCEKIKPMWKNLQSLLARVLRDQGDVEGARKAAALADQLPDEGISVADPVVARMEKYAVSAVAFATRGGRAFAAGDFARAEQEFAQALRLRPDVAFRHYDMGRLRSRQGRGDEAIDFYRKAVSLDPGLTAAHYDLGFALRRAGDPAGAAESLAETVKLDPNKAEAHYQLGLVYSSQKESAKALAEMQRAVELKPQNVSYAQTLAMHLQTLKREAEAVEALRYVLSFAKNDAALISQLAWILATSPDDKVRNGQEALDLLQPVLRQEAAADDLQLQATLAAALGEAGRFEDALAVLDVLQEKAAGSFEPFEQRLRQMRDLFEKGEALYR